MLVLNKTNDAVKCYTYMLKFEVGGELKYYYGVRCANTRLKLKPSEDLFIKYYSSSLSVKNLLDKGITPISIVIHKQFETRVDACIFESKFLKRVNARNRKDFLNTHDNNNTPFIVCNVGRVLSEDHINKISKAVSSRQSSEEYRRQRREKMKELWATPEFRLKMDKINENFWNGDKGKLLLESRKPTFLGKSHNDLTKQKMSAAAKLLGQNKEWTKARARARAKFSCPICSLQNLDGGNFNKHMGRSHNWSKDECTQFKNDNRSSQQIV